MDKDIRVWSADFTMEGWPDHPAKLVLSMTTLCLGIAIDWDVLFFLCQWCICSFLFVARWWVIAIDCLESEGYIEIVEECLSIRLVILEFKSLWKLEGIVVKLLFRLLRNFRTTYILDSIYISYPGCNKSLRNQSTCC